MGTRRGRWRLAIATAVTAALAVAVAAGGPASAGASTSARASAAGCITRLPLNWSISSDYAAAWRKQITLDVSTKGPEIRNLTATLSTFGGNVLGKATLSKPLTGGARIRLALRFPMQPGKYTLYFLGEPNANPSCGPKHSTAILRLVDCSQRLPVTIANTTEGRAADYHGYYSFDVRDPKGIVMRGLSASMSTFEGRVVGQAKIPVLFGGVHVSIRLTRALQPLPERYTVDIGGFPPGRPRSCGAAHADRAVQFN
jgi:hypothetical protein